MRAWWVAVAVGVGVAIWVAVRAHSPEVRNYPSAGTDVIAFGDSLVAGEGATAGHDLVSDLSAQVGVPIVNLGHSGDTTADALARVSQLDTYKPKVVIIVLGGNDYLRRLPIDQAFKNLGQIVEAAQSRGAAVLLVGFRMNALVGDFDAQFAQLAKQYQTAYVPNVLDGILGNKAMLSDDIHPNDQGYALMAGRIAPELKKLLQ